jgi:hypothetical protein
VSTNAHSPGEQKGLVAGPLYYVPRALVEVHIERKITEKKAIDTLSVGEPAFFLTKYDLDKGQR